MLNDPNEIENFLSSEGYKNVKVDFFEKKSDKFIYSIITPVHNHEGVIIKNLNHNLKNISKDFELIMIFDNCEDKSLEVVKEFLNKNTFSNLKKITLVKSAYPLFETTCDNIGFKLSTANYVIEIQADIQIFTYGYDHIMSRPFEKYNDVFSVSGRCVHGLFDYSQGLGKLGVDVEIPLNLRFEQYDKFYVGDTCNRGPWMIDREKLKTLNYLDEVNFVLGNDDHDINTRAKTYNQWVCGYIPIEFRSILSEGATRKSRSALNQEVLNKRSSVSNGGITEKIRRGEQSYSSTKIHERNL